MDLIRPNLERAEFTSAVSAHAAEAGVRDLTDLARFGTKSYGIDAGTPADQHTQRMLDSGDFGPSGWRLVQ